MAQVKEVILTTRNERMLNFFQKPASFFLINHVNNTLSLPYISLKSFIGFPFIVFRIKFKLLDMAEKSFQDLTLFYLFCLTFSLYLQLNRYGCSWFSILTMLSTQGHNILGHRATLRKPFRSSLPIFHDSLDESPLP